MYFAERTIIALGADVAHLLPRIGAQVTGRCWGVVHIQLSPEEASALRGIPVTNVRDLAFFFEPDRYTDKLKFVHMGGGYTNYAHTRDGLSLPFKTREESLFATREDEEHCRALLRECLPQLADRPFVDNLLCWFADTDDSDYIIDFVPGTGSSLIVVSGDSGHGYKMLPIFGEFVQTLLENSSQSERKWRWKDGKTAAGGAWRSSASQELGAVSRAKL